jgi:hypothetical protein
MRPVDEVFASDAGSIPDEQPPSTTAQSSDQHAMPKRLGILHLSNKPRQPPAGSDLLTTSRVCELGLQGLQKSLGGALKGVGESLPGHEMVHRALFFTVEVAAQAHVRGDQVPLLGAVLRGRTRRMTPRTVFSPYLRPGFLDMREQPA